ncbi:hypothetical protein [Salinarimonas soli]|uniref:Uncharacterized protein n=1 Tax=Salinarimonas soli TaxID=1638099 RepID=A0A5B2VEE9_9HYPH|nr:hypothetical protein [Salinarimonas soli]KAA2237471.1 hypothetical protein F0L46_10780 [Salinarimonas soli]
MKSVLFAAFVATLGAAIVPAQAQAQAPSADPLVRLAQFGGYYEGRPQRYIEGPVYRRGPSYQEEEAYDPRPRRRYYEQEEAYSPRPRRAGRFGQACETSRGTCYVNPQPIGSRCRCDIPGFGPKRGNVAY